MAISAPTSYPYAEVEFHTASALYAVARGGGWDTTQPTRDLISVQTEKDLDSPVGTWQVVLTGARGSDGMDWYDRLTENDLVVLKMGRPPETLATVMVGLVDEVRRSRSMGSDGTPTQQVLVRGSDFAKILTKAMLRFYPALANDPNMSDNSFYQTAGGWQAMFNFFVGSDLIEGKPSSMIKQSIYKILFRIMNMSFKYWDSSKGIQQDMHLVNILRYRLADTPNIIPFLLTMVDYEGAYWNFIERISIKPFNELFLDTRGDMPGMAIEANKMVPNTADDSGYGQNEVNYMAKNGVTGNPWYAQNFGDDKSCVYLFLRNTPFDYDRWNGLYTHTIQYDEIISEDIGRSDQENYNTFMAYNSLSVPTDTNLKLLVKPVMDQANAKLYGMNPLEVQIEGISVENGKINDGIAAAHSLSQKLYDWYHQNKDYRTGTVTVKGNGFYKVGQRLCVQACEYDKTSKKWVDLYFYIEGVQQNFTMFEQWTTTLTLTRGQTSGMTPRPTPPPTPAAKTPTITPPKPNNRYYTVVRGDTIWGIAKHYYGNGLQWTKIWNANKTMLITRDKRDAKDPAHWIYPGQRLLIPS